jgi:hypothetical protein
MTQPLPAKHQCFMQDYSRLDNRSIHAHLRGRSPRAHAYTVFHAMSHLLGRQQSAPEDYKRLARWLHRHHRELNSAVQAVVNTAVAITGITSGIALYLLIIN